MVSVILAEVPVGDTTVSGLSYRSKDLHVDNEVNVQKRKARVSGQLVSNVNTSDLREPDS